MSCISKTISGSLIVIRKTQQEAVYLRNFETVSVAFNCIQKDKQSPLMPCEPKTVSVSLDRDQKKQNSLLQCSCESGAVIVVVKNQVSVYPHSSE